MKEYRYRDQQLHIEIGGSLRPLEEISLWLRKDHCGAVNIFEGVTRNHDSGKEVSGLSYDCYPEMALSECRMIAAKACETFGLGAVCILHKTGYVPVGSTSMIVGVSSPHRKESADAVLWIIAAVKKDVPIWKKEFFTGEPARWKEQL
jgi:molybdopterin synthase catalytic subunit